jgi:6-phosphogluconolactonase (cycloisomerase 2 family)
MNARVVLAAGAGFALLIPAAAALQTPVTLQNAGAESGSAASDATTVVAIPGWTRTSNFNVVRYGAVDGYPSAATSTTIGGGANVFAGGPNAASSSATQLVDLSAHAAAIDADLRRANLAAFLGGTGRQDDKGTVDALYLSGTGVVLGGLRVGPVSDRDREGRTTLVRRQAMGPVPPGARAIRIVMRATRAQGSYNNAYFDNVRVILGPTADDPLGFPVTGTVAQLAGSAACVTLDGSDGIGGACGRQSGLAGATDVALSPDGRNVYVVSVLSDSITVFRRNPFSGQLFLLNTDADCWSKTGSGGRCRQGRALNGAGGVIVSPDGRNVYVTARGSDAVAVFKRNIVTGVLTQAQDRTACISSTGSGGLCTNGRRLNAAWAIDGGAATIYVAARHSDAVAVLRRDPVTGNLTQLAGAAGCIAAASGAGCTVGRGLRGTHDVALVGNSVYVAARDSEAVAVFKRNPDGSLKQLPGKDGCLTTRQNTPCTTAGHGKPYVLAASDDGKNLYVGTEHGIAVFARTSADSAPVQLSGSDGCVGRSVNRICREGPPKIEALTLSRDGRTVYGLSWDASPFGVVQGYVRAASGALNRIAAEAGCVSAESRSIPSCDYVRALQLPSAAAVSHDGRHVYVAGWHSNSVAVFQRRQSGLASG